MLSSVALNHHQVDAEGLRSPARAALAAHHSVVSAKEREIEALAAPVARAQAAFNEADAAAREAAAALAAIDQAERDDLVAAATTGAETPNRSRERTAAQNRLNTARRRADLARETVSAVTAPWNDARSEIAALEGETLERVLAVCIESNAADLAEEAELFKRLFAVQLRRFSRGSAISLEGRGLADQGKPAGVVWCRAAEAMAMASAAALGYVPPSPGDLYRVAPDVMAYLGALARDPDAEFTP